MPCVSVSMSALIARVTTREDFGERAADLAQFVQKEGRLRKRRSRSGAEGRPVSTEQEAEQSLSQWLAYITFQHRHGGLDLNLQDLAQGIPRAR